MTDDGSYKTGATVVMEPNSPITPNINHGPLGSIGNAIYVAKQVSVCSCVPVQVCISLLLLTEISICVALFRHWCPVVPYSEYQIRSVRSIPSSDNFIYSVLKVSAM